MNGQEVKILMGMLTVSSAALTEMILALVEATGILRLHFRRQLVLFALIAVLYMILSTQANLMVHHYVVLGILGALGLNLFLYGLEILKISAASLLYTGIILAGISLLFLGAYYL